MNLDLPIGVAKVLAGLLILGSGVWIGGFVAIMVFNASSKKALGRPERIALFRELGHRYLKVAGVALALVAVPGACSWPTAQRTASPSRCWLWRSP